jgi:hypothetical protein
MVVLTEYGQGLIEMLPDEAVTVYLARLQNDFEVEHPQDTSPTKWGPIIVPARLEDRVRRLAPPGVEVIASIHS